MTKTTKTIVILQHRSSRLLVSIKDIYIDTIFRTYLFCKTMNSKRARHTQNQKLEILHSYVRKQLTQHLDRRSRLDSPRL